MDNRFARLLDHEDYDVTVEGVTVRAHQGVFSPDPELTNSTRLIICHLPEVKGKTVADIGCGTGIIGIACALRGAARVIAGDVSDRAVDNAQQNVQQHGVDNVVEVRKSDLFQKIPERFDYIFGNLPILDEVWMNEKGGALLLVQRFVVEAMDHLNPGGSIYFPWGSFSDIGPIKEWVNQQNMQVDELQEEALGYTWTLFKIQPA